MNLCKTCGRRASERTWSAFDGDEYDAGSCPDRLHDLADAAEEMRYQLAALEPLASVLNSRQHAGLAITPIMWATLFDRCAQAKAALPNGNPCGEARVTE